MAKSYLDKDGLLYFWQKIKNVFVTDVTYDSTNKKIQKTKAGSTSDVVTLSTVATSGSYNDLSNKPTIPTLKNVFGKVKVGSTTVEADTTQDTLELAAGSNVTLTPDTTNDKVTIAATDTTYSAGTGLSLSGTTFNNTGVTDIFMDTENGLLKKTKGGSNSIVTPLTTVALTGSYNDLVDIPTIPTLKNVFGKVKVGSTTVEADTTQDTLELAAGDGISLTPDATNDKVTIAGTLATGSKPGMLSSSDFTKLSGIATGAEVNQNAFSNVKVGSTTVAADSKTDTLELAAGDNITLTPDATNDKVTINAVITEQLSVSTTSDKQVKIKNNATTAEHYAIASSQKAAANGVCPLNANTKIDATYLPSYVDDVIEVYARSGQTALSQNWFATGSASGTVVTPEAGKIYVLMADSGDYAANTQFRWGGSAYVKMADGGVSSITNAEIDTIVAA